MSDAIQVAQQRMKSYVKAIAKKESEIEELKELMGDLESFIEFGEALIGESQPDSIKPTSRPISQQVTPKQSQPADPAQDWDSVEPNEGISRVLANRAS